MIKRFHGRVALAAALFGLCLSAGVAGQGSALAATQPTTDAQLIDTVRQAMAASDLSALEGLVNWDGATPRGHRLVTYELRYGFGRAIQSITLEPFPQSGFAEMEARGEFKVNMPVSQRLRIVFDEPADGDGHKPGVMFLIGRKADAYRIALVVPTKPPNRN